MSTFTNFGPLDIDLLQWNGSTFDGITKINGTSNSDDLQWGSLFNNIENGIILQDGAVSTFPLLSESFQLIPILQAGDYCSETINNLQHFLFAYFGDIDDTTFLEMSGPKTASVGSTAQCTSWLISIPS